jgi:multiple sugar transport system ATP-binding protein
VEIVEPLGADTLVFSRLGGREIVSRIATTAGLRAGGTTRVHVDMERTHLFDPETGVRLGGAIAARSAEGARIGASAG